MRVALEEHFICPDFLEYLAKGMPRVSPASYDRLIEDLSDFGDKRLAAMDGAGVRLAVLSLSGPGVQVERDAGLAVRRAREANDFLAAEVQRRPDRYAGFAHLAMQDPAAAADELERCVRDLGFVGSMVNGHTEGVYLDDPRHDPFWERMQALDVPLYLHPGDSFQKPYVLEGCDELLKPVWEWTIETSSHFLRLVFAGVFDRFPRLKIVLGHMGGDASLRALAARQPGGADRRQAPAGPRALGLSEAQSLRDHLRAVRRRSADRSARRARPRPCDVLGRLPLRGLRDGGPFPRPCGARRRRSSQGGERQRREPHAAEAVFERREKPKKRQAPLLPRGEGVAGGDG